MNLFQQLLTRYRLMRWRKKLKADRGFNLRVRNPSQFLQNLDAQGVKYVVLRWYDELPQVLDRRVADDVDLLVEHGSLARIAAAVPFFNLGKKADKVKFDLYSDSGRNGLSYRRMPYYPPIRARHLLDTRVADPRGWYRIAPHAYIPALVYHLTYHKRQSSGLRLSPESSDASRLKAKKDYPALLQAEARKEGVALPPLSSLLEAHQWLQSQAWSMPFDLIKRWPDQDVWLDELYRYEAAQIDSIANTAALDDDLVVLVTRQESRDPECESYILEALAQHAGSVEHIELAEQQTQRLLWWARGGNWLASKHYTLSAPALLIKCRLPEGAAALKETIRKQLSQRHGKQNWLHGTDDLNETRYYLTLLDSQAYPLPAPHGRP
ncbi:hypothetical protein EJA72_09280 [Pseudomonas sp. PB120]|uniref:hypothetical protein n=1 Tax=Pseudomonas sp. PB120 TaxID=2494700 RepID=UPI0012FD9745|nr:hypothetical protein [Pseudomonas sp. PB120]MVV48433.1 hypothetical protein [Pseudomonas sp. PB120]